MLLKINPQLNALNKQAESSEKNIPPDKKTKSGVGTFMKIIFIYFPVGIMLTTILAAILLPSSVTCANKAKHSEGKQYVGSMNKGQQAYFAENGGFGTSVDALGLGIKTQTTNYNYSVRVTKKAAFNYGVSRKDLKSVVGAVFLVPVSPAANNDKTTVSILCQANSPGNTQPPNPIVQNDVPVCAAGTTEVPK